MLKFEIDRPLRQCFERIHFKLQRILDSKQPVNITKFSVKIIKFKPIYCQKRKDGILSLQLMKEWKMALRIKNEFEILTDLKHLAQRRNETLMATAGRLLREYESNLDPSLLFEARKLLEFVSEDLKIRDQKNSNSQSVGGSLTFPPQDMD